jgi:hypothetical protein
MTGERPESAHRGHSTRAAPGAKVTSLGCYITFELAEVALSRQMFAGILSLIAQGAGITRAGMSSARSSTGKRRGGGSPRRGQSSAVQCSGSNQPSASIAYSLSKPVKGTILASEPPGIW